MALRAEERQSHFISDGDQRQAVIRGEPAPATGLVGASVGDTVVCPAYGMSSVAVNFTGVVAPSFAFESSNDGQATWNPVLMFSSTFVSTGTSGVGFGQWEGGIPAGSTHFRVRCTAASAPGLTALVSPSSAPYRTSQIVSIVSGSAVSLNGGGARVGSVGAQSQASYTNETTTPLAATGTATGFTRDLALTTSGGDITSTSAGMKELRAMAVADVAGTLFVEVSADQVTWWRIAATPLAALGTIFYAQVSVLPVTRYARAVFLNGAAGQTTFLLSTARFD